MNCTFRYRLYPTVKQQILLNEMLRDHCSLYNAALQERRDAYQMRKHSVSYYDQSAQVKDIRFFDPEQARWSFSSQQLTLRRLDKAFAAFFRRVKAGQTPGYPRFKAATRFNTVTFVNGDDAKWLDQHVRLQGIGHIKVKLHRPTQGVIKQVSVTRQGQKWYVNVICVGVPKQIRPPTGAVVGLDRGITHLLADSDGGFSVNPRHARKAVARLTAAQQSLSGCKRGSNRRRKAVARVAEQHRKVRDARADHLHKLSRKLVDSYDLIVLEDLRVANMVRRPEPRPDPDAPGGWLPNNAAAKAGLNKSILDAGWSTLARMLQYKAASADIDVVFVPAANTSRTCFACGYCSADNRNGETFVCLQCGRSAHADSNAAQNILRAGLALQAAQAG